MEQRWRAIYNDGTSLSQYDSEGKANGYQNIDRTKLVAFEVYIPNGDVKSVNGELEPKDKILFKLHLEPEQRLVCRILGIKTVFAATGKDVKPDDHIFMVGWQQNVNGKNIQSIAYVYADGHVEQAGKWIGNPPNLRPEEV